MKDSKDSTKMCVRLGWATGRSISCPVGHHQAKPLLDSPQEATHANATAIIIRHPCFCGSAALLLHSQSPTKSRPIAASLRGNAAVMLRHLSSATVGCVSYVPNAVLPASPRAACSARAPQSLAASA